MYSLKFASCTGKDGGLIWSLHRKLIYHVVLWAGELYPTNQWRTKFFHTNFCQEPILCSTPFASCTGGDGGFSYDTQTGDMNSRAANTPIHFCFVFSIMSCITRHSLPLQASLVLFLSLPSRSVLHSVRHSVSQSDGSVSSLQAIRPFDNQFPS